MTFNQVIVGLITIDGDLCCVSVFLFPFSHFLWYRLKVSGEDHDIPDQCYIVSISYDLEAFKKLS